MFEDSNFVMKCYKLFNLLYKIMHKSTINKSQELKQQVKNLKTSKKWKDNTPPKQVYKSRSLILNNPLTKSSFQLNDTSFFSKMMVQKKNKPHPKSTVQIVKKLQRYTVFNKLNHSQTISPTNKQKVSSFSTMPRINVSKLKKTIQELPKLDRNPSKAKFKLLFREQKKRMSLSQKKIYRLDRKIKELSARNKVMTAMMPQKKQEAVKEIKAPRGIIVPQYKIRELIDSLIKYSELYFNLFELSRKVGIFYKKVQGFNKAVSHVMMTDQWNARRFSSRDFLEQQFWIYKQEKHRIVYFGEADLNLYNMLNGFFLKMEKIYYDEKQRFKQTHAGKMRQLKQTVAQKLQKFQNKAITDKRMISITQFVDSKKIVNYEKRQSQLSLLERRGVKFNTQQRCRELVLRDREAAFNKYKVFDIKKQ